MSAKNAEVYIDWSSPRTPSVRLGQTTHHNFKPPRTTRNKLRIQSRHPENIFSKLRLLDNPASHRKNQCFGLPTVPVFADLRVSLTGSRPIPLAPRQGKFTGRVPDGKIAVRSAKERPLTAVDGFHSMVGEDRSRHPNKAVQQPHSFIFGATPRRQAILLNSQTENYSAFFALPSLRSRAGFARAYLVAAAKAQPETKPILERLGIVLKYAAIYQFWDLGGGGPPKNSQNLHSYRSYIENHNVPIN
ncbi:hypothetical protein B0H19DRAFT_1072480 [Mycena capillaripes]|nr:hypothetical protein B0H19DRAFT_1072480 [Mycena capillaripes]